MPQSDRERVMEALAQVIKPEAIENWLTSPNPALDGKTPESVVDSGGVEKVLEIIARVSNGTHT